MRSWKSNGHVSNIGDDEAPTADVPLEVGTVSISVGLDHMCATLFSGTVRCWGVNGSGQLGQGNTSNIGDDETAMSVSDVPLP